MTDAAAPPAEAAPASPAAAAPAPAGRKGRKGKGGRPSVPFKQLFRFATKAEKIGMVVACIAGSVLGCIMPVFTIYLSDLIGSLGAAQDFMAKAESFCLAFLILAIVAFILAFIEITVPMLTAERQMRRLRVAYVRALARQDQGFYDTHPVGEAATRLAEDTILISGGIAEKLPTSLQSFVTFVAGLAVAFTASAKLTGIILCALPIIIIVMGFLKAFTTRFESDSANAYAAAGNAATEAFGAIRTVLANGGVRREVERYDSFLGLAQKAGSKKGWALGGALGTLFATIFIMYGVGVYAAAHFIVESREANPVCRINPVASGCFHGGMVLQTFMSALIGAFALGTVGPAMASIASAQAAAYKVYQVIDRVPAIDVMSPEGAKPAREGFQGRIEFRNVTFAYPSRPTEKVLNGFSLVIEPGQRVGLVGASGCGKSTLIALLLRLYDPQEGAVLVDGIDVKEWNVAHLRELLGLVSQQNVLFATTVRANIAMGRPQGVLSSATPDAIPAPTFDEVPLEEIQAAAKAAMAHDFIMQLPNGYDTIVGTSVSSAQLSGGQIQRICIARVILRGPSVLLLDEATSALDTASERHVQAAIDRMVAGHQRTCIIIAHRLSTLAAAHRIVVLQKGAIIEQGTHAELMAIPEGHYRTLRELQEVTTKAERAAATHGGSAAGAGTAAAASTDSAPATPAATKTVEEGAATAAATPAAEAVAISVQPDAAAAPATTKPAPKKAKKTSAKEVDDNPPVSSSRIWRMQLPEWRFLVLGLSGAAANGVTQPLFSIIYSSMIGSFFMGDERLLSDARTYVGYFMALAAGTFAVNLMRIGCFSLLGERLTRRLRVAAFKSALCQEVAFFDEEKNSVGKLATRLASDAALVKGATGESLSLVLSSYSAIIAAGVICFVASWRLALVCFVVLFPLLIVASWLQAKSFKGFAVGAAKKLEVSGHIVAEAVSASRTVAVFNLQASVLHSFSESLEGPLRAGYGKAFTTGVGQAYSNSLMFLGNALAYYVGARFMEQGLLTFPDLMRVFLAVVMASQAVGNAINWAPDKNKAAMAANSIFALIDRKSAINPLDEDTVPAPAGPWKGRIEFRNVTFAYPSRPGRPVLKNFSLVIEPGTRIALVGPSGSGKSTIIQLLERFYDPQEGEILVDGVNIKQLPVSWLRKHLGLVGQDPVLPSDSVGYAIAYPTEVHGRGAPMPVDDATAAAAAAADMSTRAGRRAAKAAAKAAAAAAAAAATEPVVTYVPTPAVVEAAKCANADGFIQEFKYGYATHVGQRGANVSGGQRQRIAIARCMHRKPDCMLFDEATAALDSQSEAVVQAAIDGVLSQGADAEGKKASAILIAHRLATVRNCDTIHVLENGLLKESGPHSELITLEGGLYRSLALAQDGEPAEGARPITSTT